LRQGCQLPVDSRTGKAVVHSTRIVELNWERGLRWRATVVPAAHPVPVQMKDEKGANGLGKSRRWRNCGART
jgi:hypothetical protein